MQQRKKILLVSPNSETSAELALWLVQLGYGVSGIVAEEAAFEQALHNNRPAILLIDARHIALDQLSTSGSHGLPTLYLTDPASSNKDADAVDSAPIQSLRYPYTKQSLKQRLDTLLQQHAVFEKQGEDTTEMESAAYQLEDRIFVRHKEKMVKLEIEQILYIEADSNYSRIFAKDKEYLLATTLKAMAAKLPDAHFYRIHRSYLVNIRQIDEVSETHLVIAKKALPISRSLRPGLLKRLKTI